MSYVMPTRKAQWVAQKGTGNVETVLVQPLEIATQVRELSCTKMLKLRNAGEKMTDSFASC